MTMSLAYKMPEDLDAAVMVRLKPEFEKMASMNDNISLDLSAVEFIDSSGIGGIVYLYKRLLSAGYSLSVTGARDQPLHLLNHLRLSEMLTEK
jgi:anti-anti-sigma factor